MLAALFKAYDIRGDAQLLTQYMPAIATAIGRRMQQAGAHVVALGQDGRLTSPKLADQAAKALRALGLDVIRLGLVTTPMLYFAARHDADGMGLMITASHNPPTDNGCKMMVAGRYPAPAEIAALKASLETVQSLAPRIGQETKLDIQAAYQAALLAAVPTPVRMLRVVIDAGHGVAGRFAIPLLQAAGHHVAGLYCAVDGRFPAHAPDPSQRDNLRDLQNSVRQSKADIGLAFDGDGDRLAVVAADGQIIGSEALLMLLSAAALTRHPESSIVFDVKTATQVGTWIRQHGGRPVMSATGHSLMKTTMHQHQAILGGEMSGHFFFGNDFSGDDDALLAALYVLQLVAADANAAPWRSLPTWVTTGEKHRNVANQAEAATIIAAFKKQAQRQDWGQISCLDGVRIDHHESFGLIRASNTTPVLTLYFGGATLAACQAMVAAFNRILVAIGQEALQLCENDYFWG